MKRVLTALVVAITSGWGSLSLAVPAQAATYSSTFDCNTHPGGSISAAAGDTINFTSLTNCGNIVVQTTAFASASASTSGGAVTPFTAGGDTYWQQNGIVSFSITLAGSVSSSVRITGSAAAATPPSQVFVINVGGGGGGGASSSTTSGSAPAPVLQQFGMPATGTCDEAQPEGLNWSGVAGGDWGVSWAQWVNNGNGGAVCTRTLVYSTSQSRWVVN